MTQNNRLPPLDARIPKWNTADFVYRDCPFCNSRGLEKFTRPDGLIVRMCETCGTYFVSPLPSEKAVNEFYKEYSKTHSRCGSLTEIEAEAIMAIEPLSDYRIYEIASIMDLKGKRVLDIGFGKGDMLVKTKKMGAMAEGIELDFDMVNLARKYLRLNVSTKSLKELEEKYDLIMMNDLIEHIFDPSNILTQSCQLLNEKGIMAIFTPNASFAHLEKEPICFRVDLEHLQYFTFKTCQYIAQELKLSIIHLESVGLPNLQGIDQKEVSAHHLRSALKKIILKTPLRLGFGFFTRYYSSYREMVSPSRLGKYHLFCIFQK